MKICWLPYFCSPDPDGCLRTAVLVNERHVSWIVNCRPSVQVKLFLIETCMSRPLLWGEDGDGTSP